jgi:hypothetical protein
MMNNVDRLGLDIGRVLITPTDGGGDTSFFGESLEGALSTPPFPGMFEAVPQLASRFEGRVWLVSKAGRRTEERTRLWLEHHRFYERTGISPDNLRFCRDRQGKEPICRALQLTHFVDDRLDVLGYLRGTVPSLFWFTGDPKVAPPWVATVEDWRATLDAVRPCRDSSSHEAPPS